MFTSKIKSGPLKIKFKSYLLVLFIPVTLFSQIEKQVRDQNPGLFKNQKLYHSIPNPLFKSRSHNLDFITDIPQDSVLAATLFFKTNLMEYYQEFPLNRERGFFDYGVFQTIKFFFEKFWSTLSNICCFFNFFN